MRYAIFRECNIFTHFNSRTYSSQTTRCCHSILSVLYGYFLQYVHHVARGVVFTAFGLRVPLTGGKWQARDC